jgi:hypothetical protein
MPPHQTHPGAWQGEEAADAVHDLYGSWLLVTEEKKPNLVTHMDGRRHLTEVQKEAKGFFEKVRVSWLWIGLLARAHGLFSSRQELPERAMRRLARDEVMDGDDWCGDCLWGQEGQEDPPPASGEEHDHGGQGEGSEALGGGGEKCSEAEQLFRPPEGP